MRLEVEKKITDAMIRRVMPWFVQVDQTKTEQLIYFIDTLTTHFPKKMNVTCAYDKDDHMVGLCIAVVQEDNLFLWQARSEGMTKKEVDEAMESLYDWARKRGCKTVTTIPNRDPKIWTRRWGFKEQPGSKEIIKEI